MTTRTSSTPKFTRRRKGNTTPAMQEYKATESPANKMTGIADSSPSKWLSNEFEQTNVESLSVVSTSSLTSSCSSNLDCLDYEDFEKTTNPSPRKDHKDMNESINIVRTIIDMEFLSSSNELCDNGTNGPIRNDDYDTKKSDEAAHHQPSFILFGCDMSHCSRRVQFIVCFIGMMAFTLVYGFLQELVAIQMANRKLSLFLSTSQFAGYAVWSFVLMTVPPTTEQRQQPQQADNTRYHEQPKPTKEVNTQFYIFLSILRAIDVGASYLALQFLNYPAKTLIKSSRVVFTMILGILIGRKRYGLADYVTVSLIVVGLAVFLHADARGNVVFQPLGIVLLAVSLMCDGAINNYSEIVMNKYKIEQDRFLFNLYSIAFVVMAIATHINGELSQGLRFLTTPGTWEEITNGSETSSWSVSQKMFIMASFSTTGLFGSSCAAAMTKYFGALTMSISSTARKAITLFMSFLIFRHECSFQHLSGMVIFLSALTMKSVRTSRKDRKQVVQDRRDSLSVTSLVSLSTVKSKILNSSEPDAEEKEELINNMVVQQYHPQMDFNLKIV